MYNKLFRTLLFISLITALLMIPQTDISAHPGHADPVTISRSSIVYIQQIVPYYLKIQEKLASGLLDDDIKKTALEINKAMEEAGSKEKDPSGKKMFKGVAVSADLIARAETIDEVRKGFRDLNDRLLPFFDNWPSHIKKHELVLYTCKSSKTWWLQRKGTPATPYNEDTKTCGQLLKKEE